jgi:hypothetical protein
MKVGYKSRGSFDDPPLQDIRIALGHVSAETALILAILLYDPNAPFAWQIKMLACNAAERVKNAQNKMRELQVGVS